LLVDVSLLVQRICADPARNQHEQRKSREEAFPDTYLHETPPNAARNVSALRCKVSVPIPSTSIARILSSIYPGYSDKNSSNEHYYLPIEWTY
jgi:hypothetical protein